MTHLFTLSPKSKLTAMLLSLSLTIPCSIKAQSVKSNWDKDWELSFGAEGMSFFSKKGNGDVEGNLFSSSRLSGGAALHIGKWFNPVWGTQTKASGYWGKGFANEDKRSNSIRFYSFQQFATFDALNFIKGANPYRLYSVVPYAGIGMARNCSYKANSFTIGAGVRNKLRFSPHMCGYLDLNFNCALGSKKTVLGNAASYQWASAEIGVMFNLDIPRKRVVDKEYSYNYEGASNYRKISHTNQENDGLKRVLAKNYVPEGMVLINRGHIRMGNENPDSLWGVSSPVGDVSVDDFWMDRTEVTNAMYRAFVQDVVDSIVAVRITDPYYGWDKAKALESLYLTNPITGDRTLDGSQIIYVYETYDYIGAALKRNRIGGTSEPVMVSKDTAYVDESGKIVRKTITRQLSSPYDFLNTYAVEILPDTTVWVNDFPKSDNSMYLRYYYSHEDYKDYPVVGVTWEQANAYCAWRTEQLKNKLGGSLGTEQPYRLPTEAEWEYAARSRSQNEFPWDQSLTGSGKQLLYANFQPSRGDYTVDGNIITSKVGTYPPNENGLFDMAGNVAEWTSTSYTASGIAGLNSINPQHEYNAAFDEMPSKKKKTIKGGSWKDPESHIKASWRAGEIQDKAKSFIGFRCVRSIATKPSERAVNIKSK